MHYLMTMSETAARPETVLETILRWSSTRPLWLQDALRRVVVLASIKEQDIEELKSICIAEHGSDLAYAEATARRLCAADLPASPTPSNSVTLVSISAVECANQLAPDQTLSIAPSGLTVIYGDNGSGKSGYSKILKRSCRARNRGDQIEPNIFANAPRRGAKALINYQSGAIPKNVAWSDGPNPIIPELSAISVFDSECAAIHVEGKNDVAFRPHGLDVPERLASICQRLKTSLETDWRAVAAQRDAAFQLPTWTVTTAVGAALSSLRHDTNFASLARLADMNDAEKKRLKDLREDLAKDPAVAAKELRLRIGRIKAVASYLEIVEAQTSDAKLTELARLVAESRSKRDAAKVAAESLFSASPLTGIGSDTWRELWESARRYSEGTAYPTRTFPVTADNARCVLCHQPVGAEAATHFNKLEHFVKADTEKLAKEAQVKAKTAWDALKRAEVCTWPCRAGLNELKHLEPSIGDNVRRFVIVAGLRKRAVLRAIGAKQHPSPIPASTSPLPELCEFIQRQADRATALEKAAVDTARTKLKGECAELHDRELLGTLLTKVRAEIDRLQRLHLLEKCIAAANTKPITDLGNSLAAQVLTPQLRDRFAEELIGLAGSRVRAELTFAGGKVGTPQYQVRLIARPSADVADVLSEGESKCVALAGFLTELATAEHRSAIIFDDPVSSLDHKWRQKVAKRLVKEGRTRQVVVLTHDIVFVHDLHDRAKEETVPCELRCLRRDSSGTGVVGDGLPWLGMKVEARLDDLGKRARAARTMFDAGNEDAYNREVEAIYSDLRATWERALEDVAFQRTVLRHRDYIDSGDLRKVSALTLADCDDFRRHFHKCCDVTNSHDRSPGRNPEHPEPLELLADIAALDNWVKGLRDRQKAIKV